MLAAELQRIALQSSEQLAPDDELLRRFADGRDESAFAELVRRHGSLVLGVGRRLLGDHHAGEDILQATFLLLARKADQIRWQRTIAPWLYSAAYRIASKARRRHRSIAPLSSSVPVPSNEESSDPAQPLLWQEVRVAIDEEIARLSDAMRAPLVLCYLQGRTRDEAAQALGLTLATLKRRLEHGRELLRKRLTRRGLALAAAGAAIALEDRTLPVATAHEIATAVSKGAVSTSVAALVNGSFTTGKKFAAVAIFALLGLGGGWLLTMTPDPAPPSPVKIGPEIPAQASIDVAGEALPEGAIARLGTTRLRPGVMVPAVEFSPNGKQLAIWAEDWTQGLHDRLIFADSATGKELRSIPISPSMPMAFRWLADGRGLALLKTGMDKFYLWQFSDPNSPVKLDPKGNPHATLRIAIASAAISPDGRWLATGRQSPDGSEKPIELWDAKPNSFLSEQQARVLGKQAGHCLMVAFSNDSRRLFALSSASAPPKAGPGGVIPWDGWPDKGIVCVYELSSGKQLSRFEVATPGRFLFGSEMPPKRMVVSPDDQSLLIGDGAGTIHVYDSTTGKETNSFVAHAGGDPNLFEAPGVHWMTFSPDGKALYTSSQYGEWSIRDPKTGRARATFHDPGRRPGHLFAFSPDGKQLATADTLVFSSVDLRDPITGERRVQLPGHSGSIQDLVILPYGKAITAGTDSSLRWWDLDSGRELKNREIENPRMLLPWNRFTADGAGMVLMHDRRAVFVDLASDRQTTLVDDMQHPAQAIRGIFGSDILIAKGENRFALWDSRAGKERRTFSLPSGNGNPPIGQLVLAPDQATIASVSTTTRTEGNLGYFMGGQVTLYDAKTSSIRKHWHTSAGKFECASFDADGRFLVVGGMPFGSRRSEAKNKTTLPLSFESGLLLFDARTGDAIRAFDSGLNRPSHNNRVTKISFSPNGQLLASDGDGDAVIVREVATGRICRVFGGHQNSVTRMAFTADSRRLVTVSEDMTGLVWDVSYKGLATPMAGSREGAWNALAKPDWSDAGPALAAFAAKPDEFLAFVREKLPAVDKPDIDRAAIDKWIEQLDAQKDEARELAIVELSRLKREILPLLREHLSNSTDRGKRGLERVIDLIKDMPVPLDHLRPLRAVALLLQLNSPTSRHELERLAAGHPDADLTRAAQAALKPQKH